jgi:F-type H+-transporting ATPase subunit delta
VVSAVPLDAAQADKLRAALSTRLKRKVRMQTSVDSTLLGGAVVRAGDLVIDGSLKGRLQRLATELGS